MNNIVPISDLQSKAKQFVEQVKKTDEAVVITQRGRAAAVLLSYETYEGFLATQDEMSFADWSKKLKRAKKESQEGKGITLEAYLQKRGRRG